MLFTNDADKHEKQEDKTRTLGAESQAGARVRPSMQRIFDFSGIACNALRSSEPRMKHFEIAGGVGISLTPFRRQLMAAYGHLWATLAGEVPPQDDRGSYAGKERGSEGG